MFDSPGPDILTGWALKKIIIILVSAIFTLCGLFFKGPWGTAASIGGTVGNTALQVDEVLKQNETIKQQMNEKNVTMILIVTPNAPIPETNQDQVPPEKIITNKHIKTPPVVLQQAEDAYHKTRRDQYIKIPPVVLQQAEDAYRKTQREQYIKIPSVVLQQTEDAYRRTQPNKN